MRGYLKRPDCSIYYETAGSGPALVFAHGLGGNHLSWWQQAAHFAARYTCVVFDHRGFNPSSATPGSQAPDAFADDLAALIEELQLREVRLVAQSMGGWTCLDYALRVPSKVRALVMACTSGAVNPAGVAGFGQAEFEGWLLAPRGRAVCVPQAGHSVYFERPAEFNRIVGEFLQAS